MEQTPTSSLSAALSFDVVAKCSVSVFSYIGLFSLSSIVLTMYLSGL